MSESHICYIYTAVRAEPMHTELLIILYSRTLFVNKTYIYICVFLCISIRLQWEWEPAQYNAPPCKQGLIGSHVHWLASDIVRMGFAPHAVGGAVCAELDTECGRNAQQFTADCADGDELLPPKDKWAQHVRYGSLGCGHTNAGLVGMVLGIPTECDELCMLYVYIYIYTRARNCYDLEV